MYTLKEENNYTLEQKKSKFIAIIYPVKNINEIKNILESLKKEYKDANHICYAYKINEQIKCFDDNEPNKTAGFKILDALTSNNLNNVLGIVIRYFGGIKLGVGPLSRCYYKVTKEAIKTSKIIEISNKINIFLETDINNLKLLNNIAKNYNIVTKTFTNTIIYKIEINKDDLTIIQNMLMDTNITLKKDETSN